MKKLTTTKGFDPMFGFKYIPAGTTLELEPTNYSNYKFYIKGRDFHSLGYPVTANDLEKMAGRNWQYLLK